MPEGGAWSTRARVRKALDSLGAGVLRSIMALSGRLALAALRLWGPGGEPRQGRHGVPHIGRQRCFTGGQLEAIAVVRTWPVRFSTRL